MRKNYKELHRAILDKIEKGVKCPNNTPEPLYIFKELKSDVATDLYVNLKIQDALSVGIQPIIVPIGDMIDDSLIHRLHVKAYIIQRPMCQNKVNLLTSTLTVAGAKDVDYLSSVDLLHICGGYNKPNHIPATPRGILTIMKHELGDNLNGLRIAVIGRGETVGRYLHPILSKAGCTVTQYHSKSEYRINEFHNYDVIISCVGKPNILTETNIGNNKLIIDVGVSRDENGKVVGDMPEELKRNIDTICTANVGAVGLMTRAMLLLNYYEHMEELGCIVKTK